MKRFGFGLLTAGMIAVATLLTTVPASARGGMIFIPPMGGGIGGGGWGGMHGGGGIGGGGWGGGWNGPGGRPPGGWHVPGGRPPGGYYYHGGNPHWNGHGWNGNPNWWRNGHWYGPRYRYRYPGYNWYYSGWWYPWPWWNVWNLEIGDNYGYYGGQGYGSSHVNWCLNRYRSYNPRTNTYTGYDGRQHICRGPY